MHCGYVTKVEDLRKHENADRLQIATFFGNDTVVSLDTKFGDKGVYFPSDLQLSVEYCEQNNLVRKKDENGNEIGGYLDPDKRNIRAIRLRGEKSDGLFMPLHTFNYCYEDNDAEKHLSVGDTITILNGHEICTKYIPRSNSSNHARSSSSSKSRKRIIKDPYAPQLEEHKDTKQFLFCKQEFKRGDHVEVTLKMHGTSQRTGYLPILKGYKKTFWQKLFRKQGTPIYDYGYVSGTRRVVMEQFDDPTSFYGSNIFRERHHNKFVNKLMKGETVFYEVLGFTHTGAPIMSNGNNEKVGKDFVKQYGKETVFSYGCNKDGYVEYNGTDDEGAFVVRVAEPQSILRVYRMTMTNPEGFVVEYTPDFMRHRCEQIGVECVPVFDNFIIPEDCEDPGEFVFSRIEQYIEGPDPVGKTHLREGVVVRIVNRPSCAVYKLKSYDFKVLEGIIKDTADAPDMEEAQDLTE